LKVKNEKNIPGIEMPVVHGRESNAMALGLNLVITELLLTTAVFFMSSQPKKKLDSNIQSPVSTHFKTER